MNNLNGFDVRVPSGFEVESATLHRNENRMLDDHTHDGGMKDKLYHLRSRGIEMMNTWKSDMNERISTWKPMAQERMTSMRSTVNDQISNLQTRAKGEISNLQSQMKSNPGKWAGIAAGAGLGIGLIGRMLRHRARMRSEDLPSIVIVGAC